MNDLLTTSDAARLAGIPQTRLWNYARSGHCPEPIVRAGRAFWSRHEIEKLARRLKPEAGATGKTAAA
jgi:hypothetical protein